LVYPVTPLIVEMLPEKRLFVIKDFSDVNFSRSHGAFARGAKKQRTNALSTPKNFLFGFLDITANNVLLCLKFLVAKSISCQFVGK